MTIVAYTYSGYHEINGWRMLKAPYLSRHIFPSTEQQVCPPGAQVVVFQSDEPGARYEVSPGEGNPNHRVADQYSPLIENNAPILCGIGYPITVWVPEKGAAASVAAKPSHRRRDEALASITTGGSE